MSKEIKLSKGKVAVVDDEDYEWLSQWKWFAVSGRGYWYAVRNSSRQGGRQSPIRMHRILLNAPQALLVDHINHDTLDNRKPI